MSEDLDGLKRFRRRTLDILAVVLVPELGEGFKRD